MLENQRSRRVTARQAMLKRVINAACCIIGKFSRQRTSIIENEHGRSERTTHLYSDDVVTISADELAKDHWLWIVDDTAKGTFLPSHSILILDTKADTPHFNMAAAKRVIAHMEHLALLDLLSEL